MDHEEGMNEAERRQLAFDDRMDAVRREGASAQRAGLTREDCPYAAPEERQSRTSWIGGWAEAALGIDEPALGPSPGPR